MLTERPTSIQVGSKVIYLYPVTLGKQYLLAEMMEALGIDDALLRQNAFAECLRLAHEQRGVCNRILAIHACRDKAELFGRAYQRYISCFDDKELTTENIATLLMIVLRGDNVQEVQKHFGITHDLDSLRRVQSVKKDKNNLSFCGLSVWGNMIDHAAERYGWSLDYILWGVSAANLQMMLADSVKTVYLTDKELKKVHVTPRGRMIDASKLTKEQITNMRFR